MIRTKGQFSCLLQEKKRKNWLGATFVAGWVREYSCERALTYMQLYPGCHVLDSNPIRCSGVYFHFKLISCSSSENN